MEVGVHLPQISWDGAPPSIEQVVAVATTADRLGFGTLTVNDHLVWGRPWLDGPTTLAAILTSAPRVRLMTSVALPVVRGPFALAKAMGALDLLSGGRLDAGLGPGSSAADYALVGVPFEERWARFDESVSAMRSIWDPGAPPFVGEFYDTTGVVIAPGPTQPKGPPIWVGSWGSTAGLRRVARLADGWLASAYNTTPRSLTASLATLRTMLDERGRDASSFPCTLATTWAYITDHDAEASAVRERVAAMLGRPLDEVADRLPIGPASACVDLLGRYEAAGAQRVLLWPLSDGIGQLERIAADVLPHVT